MRYLSVCSGIEAASCAWQPLGWEAIAFSEIEPFPCRVLQHRFPDVPNLGDMIKINGENYRGAVDLLVGGTPCQDFSVAGKRAGLDGERSGLARDFARLLREIRPRWFVWENVPGAFSTHSGRDFGTFIWTLAECGYGIAWRVLDAQFFGVPQRRRRIFLVGYLGDWRPSGAVLFEPASLCGNTPESRKKRPGITQSLTGCLGAGGADDNRAQAGFYVPSTCKSLLSSNQRGDYETENFIAAPVTTRGYADNAAQESKLIPSRIGVRRLTTLECERLQGFPDGWTDIQGASDTARYKALGNSMAVPVMRWIGERIERVEKHIGENHGTIHLHRIVRIENKALRTPVGRL